MKDIPSSVAADTAVHAVEIVQRALSMSAPALTLCVIGEAAATCRAGCQSQPVPCRQPGFQEKGM